MAPADQASAHAAFAPATAAPRNAMSVDVEEHFQVSAMEPVVARRDWNRHPSRVEANVDAILDLFARNGVRATFFTLGWVARRHPEMVRRIVAGGHELASHGFAHVRVHQQTAAAFRADIRRTKAVLEDIGGVPVRGYRAASFSIDARTPWAHAILAEEGHTYSSSVYPIRHDLYGMPEAPRFAYRPLPDSDFLEVPITTTTLLGRRLPCGGGGYFRLLPFPASLWAMRRVGAREGAACVFYFHPWEIDPDQPKVAGLSPRARFRHYIQLSRTMPRLERLTRRLAWDRMDRVFALAAGARASDVPPRAAE